MNGSLTALLIGLVVIFGYDAYAMIRYGLDKTISWVIWTNSKEAPIIPFVAGLICGHLFWCACGGVEMCK